MSILNLVSAISNSAARYFFDPSINNTTDDLQDSSGYTDYLSGESPDASFSKQKLTYSIEDTAGDVVAGPVSLGTHPVPGTDTTTGAIFDDYYDAADLADGVHGVFFTTPTSGSYDGNDRTSLKFETFDDAGDVIQGPRSLNLGTGTGVKDLREVHIGTLSDHGNSFVVGYTTYDPAAQTGQLRYERFDDDGDAIGGGVLRNFSGSSHGLAFGSFYTADNPNNDGQPDYMTVNRANNSSSKVQVLLSDTDMHTVASKTIQVSGPGGEAATAIDKYGFLRPGLTDAENFGALTQTYEYVDGAGKTHEEIAIETIDPQTLQVEHKTKFEVPSGTHTGVTLEHLTDGNLLAVYNDGGQTKIKEFDATLHQVGGTFALPQDNHGFDGVTGLGGDQFRIDWENTSGTSGATVKHTATFQA